MKSFKNKTILITGAAHGLGKSLAMAFARQGSHLVLVDWDLDALNQLDKEEGIGNKEEGEGAGQMIHLEHLDLRNLEAIKNLPERVKEKIGPINILINNAGVSVHGPLMDLKHEDIDWITQINYLAPMHLTKVFLPQLLAQEKGGHIVNISSAAGLHGFPKRTAYCASKSGLTGFSEALRAELWGTGVGVTSVHPGPIKTQMPSRARITDLDHQKKEISFMQEKGQSPDWMASQILSAIRKNKARLLISQEAKGLAFAKRLIPGKLSNWIGRFQDRLPI